MKISTSIVISAPSADVWAVVGPGFANPAAWASSVISSVGVDVEAGAEALPGAPYSARECAIATPGTDRLVEELTAYDAESMTLTYVVAEGLERVARRTQLTWSVSQTPEGSSRLRIDTVLTPTLLGHAMRPLLRRALATAARRNAEDLRHFVKTGHRSTPAIRQKVGLPSLGRSMAWNAVFTWLCGAVLLTFAAWWASQFSDVSVAVIAVLGVGLLVYGIALAWVARRGATATIGRVFAVMDAAWVVGVAGLVAVTGRSFSPLGIVAALATSAVVAAFGVLQWRGSRVTSEGGETLR